MNGLPKGICLDHGYIQVRIQHAGILRTKNFGKDSPFAREMASIYLAERRKEILMGKCGMTPPAPKRRFKEVCALWLPLWRKEADGDGRPIHSELSIYERERTINKVLIPAFGDKWFDEITTPMVEDWREGLLADQERGISGTTINRYQGPLSAIFTDTMKWVEAGKIKPAFALPAKNPCLSATWAKNKVRDRVLTQYELRKLKNAFFSLNDADGWSICKMALKSTLSMADLKALDTGDTIDTQRTKTGVPVNIPIQVKVMFQWKNWRRRWEAAREAAGLVDVQFRDLRKTGINMIAGRHDTKLVSQYAGHASVKTTEGIYTQVLHEKLRPLAEDLESQVESI